MSHYEPAQRHLRGGAAVRSARLYDLGRVVEIDRLCGLAVWRLQTYLNLLRRREIRFQVAVEAGMSNRVEGFCVAQILGDEAEILKIAVDPARQGNRLGQLLLDSSLEAALVSGCRCSYLEVRRSNNVALFFYEKNGFQLHSVRREYYSNPVEDALVLKKVLIPPTQNREMRTFGLGE